MSKKRGRLRSEDEQKIVQNWMYLKETFDPKDGVLDQMFSDLVFDFSDKDKVKNGGENTMAERCERFLNILCSSGPDAYSFFLKALKATGFHHIVDKLESTVISPKAE